MNERMNGWNTDSPIWEPIVKYINEQYEKYLKEELHVNRKRRIPDTRVHCCVYFLPATGHWLRPIDVEFMKRLGKIVSIVPVIAKADTLTMEERLEFKQRIRQGLQANGIRVYPQKEYDEDAEERILNDKIRESIPFAVVGTDKEHQVNGNKVLGRKTKWGIIEVENVAHCEFAHLRDLLISPVIIHPMQLEHPHTVPADGAVGVEVEGHQVFWLKRDSSLKMTRCHSESLHDSLVPPARSEGRHPQYPLRDVPGEETEREQCQWTGPFSPEPGERYHGEERDRESALKGACLSPMDPGIAILEYGRAIREEETH
ncbi:hypothetical protein NFI96_014463 [Prochilodus magdalenae]|nr:hypothetical protein NFI96_014463 [Prochilodus magdalenae]